MKIYRIAHKLCYLDVGHNENSLAWGFSFDDNWITTDKTWDEMGNSDLHGDRDDFDSRGRIDHKTKLISFVPLGSISDEDIEAVKNMLRHDYPGYTIIEF